MWFFIAKLRGGDWNWEKWDGVRSHQRKPNSGFWSRGGGYGLWVWKWRVVLFGRGCSSLTLKAKDIRCVGQWCRGNEKWFDESFDSDEITTSLFSFFLVFCCMNNWVHLSNVMNDVTSKELVWEIKCNFL